MENSKQEQSTGEEPGWEKCPYCDDYHPTGTSEQCTAKPK